jgi:hypothetical protein
MQDSVLILGAGNSKLHKVQIMTPGAEPGGPAFSDNFKDVWTIDMDPSAHPRVLWDLENFPWPVPQGYFDEVHAYEVLEHLGRLGDYEAFFATWKEIWGALKVGGLVVATSPWWESVWAWQDPGHRRIYSRELLAYLDQKEYSRQIGVTAMTDYRRVFPPPFSFNFMTDAKHSPGTEEGGPFDPKCGGYMFVLKKEDSNGGG